LQTISHDNSLHFDGIFQVYPILADTRVGGAGTDMSALHTVMGAKSEDSIYVATFGAVNRTTACVLTNNVAMEAGF
jgi:hypothetical protein